MFKSFLKALSLYLTGLFKNTNEKHNYYRKIKLWEEKNKKRKKPRTYHVFRLDGEDAKKNAIFSSYKLGIKSHMIFRGYIGKIASLIAPSEIQKMLFRFAGLVVEENVFIAPELTIDVVVSRWTRFRKGCSVGIGVKCFNHLFDQNGRIILGYIDIGEGASLGGFVTISPGVTIGENANIAAEVKIGPGVKIGKNVKIGPGAMIAPFLTIGDNVQITTGSVVLESVKPDSRVHGNPAKEVPIKIKKQMIKKTLLTDYKSTDISSETFVCS